MEFINSSSKLIEWCGAMFPNAVFAVYEQIRPNDGFGRVMQQHFVQLSIPLLSLPIYPNQEYQRKRYLQRVINFQAQFAPSHILLTFAFL